MTDNVTPFMTRKERERKQDMSAYMEHFNTTTLATLERLGERMANGGVDAMLLVYSWTDEDGDPCTTRFWCVPTLDRAALMSLQAQVAITEIQEGARDQDELPGEEGD